MIYDFKNLRFVRWGTLSQKKGKAISNEDFHKAPSDVGLYAFPKLFDEPFLVDWKYCEDNADAPLIKEALIKKGINPEEFLKLLNNNDDNAFNFFEQISHRITKEKKRKDYKVFKYHGNVWHHFVSQSKSPIRNKFWVLDSYDDYIICLKKYIHTVAKDFFNKKHGYDTILVKDNVINGVRKFFAKDEFEVYLVDKIK